MKYRFSAAVILLGLSAGVQVTDALADSNVGMRLGTTGVGVEYSHRAGEHLDLRGGYWFGALSRNQTEDGVDYEATTSAKSVALVADYRPFAGVFRISAGVYSRAPVIELYAKGRDDYELGNSRYTGDLVLDGEVEWDGLAPYLGLGWGGMTTGTGWALSLDVGVLLLGDTGADLDVSGRACDSSLLACDPNGLTGFDVQGSTPQAQEFQASVDAEERRIEEDGDDIGVWPVLMFGLHYRF